MSFKRITYIFFILLVNSFAFSQNRALDSLVKRLPQEHDTMKVKILCSLSRSFEGNNPEKSVILADSALKIAIRIKYQMGIGTAYGSLGSCLCTSGKYDEAIKALIKSLKIFEALKAKGAVGNTYNSLANAYMGLKDNNKAYDYFLKANEIAKQPPRNEGMVAVTSVGLGNMLLGKNEFKKAVEYFKFAENFFREKGVTNYEAMCITSIGEAYIKDSNFVDAEKYFLKSINLFKKGNDEYGLGIVLQSLGGIEVRKKNYKQAEIYYTQSLQINLKRKAWDNIQSAALGLAEILEIQNKPTEALKNFRLYMQYKDSVINIERHRSIAESESKYESEKKEQQIKLQNSELEKSQIKVNQRNHLIYVFASAIIIFVILLFFVYKQFREKKKANVLLTNKNEEIEKQKSVIEEKNKDITDSINYSKHIQQAIIPSLKKVREMLPNSFVIFQPKDIVSGDFYLVEEVVGLIYLAVIDCTGHGVPGAMLSVFANSTIKNTISSNDFRDNPAAILSDLCFQFKNNLQSHNTTMTVNDGVDMGICIIDKKLGKIYFAGAKNGLIQIRNKELIEYPADRWGISGSNTKQQLFFTNYVIDVQKGDKFYLGTDGFIDQFGGPKGKKFKQKQLKDLVITYSDLGYDEQAESLLRDFNSWKGRLEQIDDVTLIGFEI